MLFDGFVVQKFAMRKYCLCKRFRISFFRHYATLWCSNSIFELVKSGTVYCHQFFTVAEYMFDRTLLEVVQCQLLYRTNLFGGRNSFLMVIVALESFD